MLARLRRRRRATTCASRSSPSRTSRAATSSCRRSGTRCTSSSTLDRPEMVGVNPEVAHETMAGLSFHHARRAGAVGGQAVPHRPQRAADRPLRPGLPLRRRGPQGGVPARAAARARGLRRARATSTRTPTATRTPRASGTSRAAACAPTSRWPSGRATSTRCPRSRRRSPPPRRPSWPRRRARRRRRGRRAQGRGRPARRAGAARLRQRGARPAPGRGPARRRAERTRRRRQLALTTRRVREDAPQRRGGRGAAHGGLARRARSATTRGGVPLGREHARGQLRLEPGHQPRSPAWRSSRRRRRRCGLSRFAAEATPTPSQWPASSSAASARSSPASARCGQLGDAGVRGASPAASQQRAERDARLQAAAVAAGAELAVGIDGDVAELAAEAVRAAEQLAADDDARADAELARDVDEVAEARARRPPTARRARRGSPRSRRGSGSRPRRGARAAARARRRPPSRGWARRAGGRSAVDEARAARRPRRPSAAARLAARRARRAASPARSSSTSSTPRPRLSTATSARVALGRRCRSAARTARKSTPISSPRPTTRRPLELDRQRGPADGAAQLDLGLAHEPEVDQLADEARDRRLVQPGLLRDRGARARPALGDVAQHDAEVVAPDGPLVRAGCCRDRRAPRADPNAQRRRARSRPRRCAAIVSSGLSRRALALSARGGVERRDRARLADRVRAPDGCGRSPRTRGARSPRARTAYGSAGLDLDRLGARPAGAARSAASRECHGSGRNSEPLVARPPRARRGGHVEPAVEACRARRRRSAACRRSARRRRRRPSPGCAADAARARRASSRMRAHAVAADVHQRRRRRASRLQPHVAGPVGRAMSNENAARTSRSSPIAPSRDQLAQPPRSAGGGAT